MQLIMLFMGWALPPVTISKSNIAEAAGIERRISPSISGSVYVVSTCCFAFIYAPHSPFLPAFFW